MPEQEQARVGILGRARDRVAHFHLSNGARVERLNRLADRSAKGLEQSAGIIANHRYRLGQIDASHEAYTGKGTPPRPRCAGCCSEAGGATSRIARAQGAVIETVAVS